MVLRKQTVPVIFDGGLDTKTAEQLVVPGKFLVCQNAVRLRQGAVRKRYGFQALGTGILNSTDVITQGKSLLKFGDELILFGRDSTSTIDEVYSYSASKNNWAGKGVTYNSALEASNLLRNANSQALQDFAFTSDLIVTVYEDSRGGVRGQVVNKSTGAVLVSDLLLNANAAYPKCVALDRYFVVAYIDTASSTLKTRTVNVANPAQFSAETTIFTSMANFPIDLERYNDEAAIFVATRSGSGIKVGYIFEDGSAGSPGINGLPAAVDYTEAGTNAVSILADATNEVVLIASHNGSNNLIVRGCNGALTLSSSYTAVTLANIRNISLIKQAVGSYNMIYEVGAADRKNHYIVFDDISYTTGGTASNGPTASYTVAKSVGLGSQIWVDPVTGIKVFLATYDSSLQPSYFILDLNGNIYGQINQNVGGGHTQSASNALKSGVPSVVISDNTALVTTRIRSRLRAEASDGSDAFTLSGNFGLQYTAVTINPEKQYGTDINGQLLVAGGSIKLYDGVQFVEHGFYQFPENVAGASVAGSGTLSPGDYSFKVIYEWVDGRGNIHRSAPSILDTVTISGSNVIQVTVPTLRLTSKSDVKIVVYMAEVNLSTVLYRAAEVLNNKSADTVTINIASATALNTKEILYTTGGIVENIAPPAASVVHQHQGRVYLGGLEDGNAIWYSKSKVSGEGISFYDGFTLSTDQIGGRITGISSIDDKIVIFKESAVYLLSGGGPLDTGTQNDYNGPELITSDIGLTNPDSIVITPVGVMFKSAKGIYCLTRGLQLNYIGAAVEKFNNLDISSAISIDNQNEVRFTTTDGECIVYNYLFDQWSTFTNYKATDAIYALNSYIHLTSDGKVNKEVIGSYLDNGAKISMIIETSWISLAELQGYQRIYNIAVLGDFISHHTTKIKLAYDFEKSYNETVYFNTQTGLSTEYYGSDAYYGEDKTYGGDEASSVYQFSLKPAIQKCSSMKIYLEDIDTIEESGGGSFNLVAITLEAGMKGGINRLGSQKQVGSLK